jgi:hypothetical protein
VGWQQETRQLSGSRSMRATCPTAFGLALPERLFEGARLVGPGAALVLALRRWVERLAPSRRRRPGGNGPPPELPEEDPARDSLWNDPVFWMWMVH